MKNKRIFSHQGRQATNVVRQKELLIDLIHNFVAVNVSKWALVEKM